MPLNHMLRENASFDPEKVEVIAGAYEDALIILQLSEENLSMREPLATRILSMATAGERSRKRRLAQVSDAGEPARLF